MVLTFCPSPKDQGGGRVRSYPPSRHDARRFVRDVRRNGRTLIGLAAPYGQTALLGTIEERIAPGAFARTLEENDEILALVDHDPARLLARRSTGTLHLRDTAEGLVYEIDVPDTTDGRDVLALAERGDLGGMSIGFRFREGGVTVENNLRTLTDIELCEISVVSAWPAYQGTSVSARSKIDGQAAFIKRLGEVL